MNDAIPLTGAQTLHPNNVETAVPQIEYSKEAKDYILFRRNRMIAARDVRDTQHEEFDDMTFIKYYDTLKKADDQYVAPRKNKSDTSINVGTIKDKDTTLVEYAMKYDFEPVAQVFTEDDDMLEELADTAEDMVRKSKLLEAYKEKAKRTYRSMVAFGTACVEDKWVERWVLEKTITKGYKAGLGGTQAEWTEKLVKKYDGCQAKLWDLRKCYFGDFRKFDMNGPDGQPYFFTVEYESYDVMKQIFGNWDRWRYVPTQVVLTPEISSATTWASYWTLRPITPNYVEKIMYYDPIANEVALTLNGVDMLPIMERKGKDAAGAEKTYISGYPLTEISPSGAIPFAKFDLEPRHDCAYSTSQPGKMRILADVENMWYKIMLRMMKQKSDPTMGNKSSRMFGPEATMPGTMINDIRDGDLFPILPNFAGATPTDFTFYEATKKELDKNSVQRSFQGIDTPQGAETATGDMNNMEAQALDVASMFDGIISGENQLNWLRTYNILKNWTNPIDQKVDVARKTLENVYRTVTMPTTIDGGQKATKKIVFTKDTPIVPNGKPSLEHSQSVHQAEMDHEKDNGGGQVRYVFMHPEVLAQTKLSWYYTCVPVPNGSDPLAYMMFIKQINDAITVFGPDSLNVKKLKHMFAAKTGQDFDTWFISEQELEQKQQQAQAAAAAQGGPNGSPQGNNNIPNAGKTGAPSIASAIQGKGATQGMAAVMGK